MNNQQKFYNLNYSPRFRHELFVCEPAEELDENGLGTGVFRFVAHCDSTGEVRAIGACEDCAGHATAQEAIEHYRSGLLEWHLHEIDEPGDHSAEQVERKCAVCGELTQGGMSIILDKFSLSWHFPLCSIHRTRASVETLFCLSPFHFVAWTGDELLDPWDLLCNGEPALRQRGRDWKEPTGIPDADNGQIYDVSTESFSVDVRSCRPAQIKIKEEPSGLWHMVELSNEKGTCRAIGLCSKGCCGHDTAEGARAHYTEWLVYHSGYLKFVQNEPSVRPCLVCEAPTRGKGYIGIDDLKRHWSFRLCPKHQTQDCVAKFLEVEDFEWAAWCPEVFG